MKSFFSSRILVTLAIGGLLVIPNIGLAKDVVGSGTVTYIQTSSSSDTLTDGTTIEHFTSAAVILCDDAENSLHLAQQDVAGTNIIDAKGEVVTSTGHGSAVDRDGDIMVFWWKDGEWGFFGGTGKYAKVKGGGTSTTLLITADGRQVITWEGKWTE